MVGCSCLVLGTTSVVEDGDGEPRLYRNPFELQFWEWSLRGNAAGFI